MNYTGYLRPITKAFLMLMLASAIVLVSCRTQEVQTHWSVEPVRVDGEMVDWTSGSMFYFEDPGVQLGLSNDSRNLYLLFRFSNQAWARAIRMGGITLWLDNSGKKKKDYGIRYTGGPPLLGLRMPGASDQGGFRGAMTSEQQQRLSEMEQDSTGRITLIDNKSNQEISLRTDGSGGPTIAFASPQGIYSYEFSIPLDKNDVFDYGIGAKPGQIISLGLEWGGMSKEDRQKMREKMGGGMGGGPPGGMGRGSMGGGQGGRPGSGSRSQSTEKQELWVKTQLALPPEV
jgi:hypothetical protein